MRLPIAQESLDVALYLRRRDPVARRDVDHVDVDIPGEAPLYGAERHQHHVETGVGCSPTRIQGRDIAAVNRREVLPVTSLRIPVKTDKTMSWVDFRIFPKIQSPQ